MDQLIALAEQIAAVLRERSETISIAESSTGGLISAALLSVPGASSYFVGGAIVYTGTARAALLSLSVADLEGIRPSTPAYAHLLASTARARFSTTWTLAESGATGPTGNRYGDAAGHTCLAVSGPTERDRTLETGSTNRGENMFAFGRAGLTLLLECAQFTSSTLGR